ncbi:hypothetical protein H9L39_18830, partial [Fusarium oxysporum f. sp. albedinis]
RTGYEQLSPSLSPELITAIASFSSYHLLIVSRDIASDKMDFRCHLGVHAENSNILIHADTWPIHDNANPLNGWSANEVETTPSGLVTSNIYGKLFYYVRSMLKAFMKRITYLVMTFQLFQLDASDLAAHLGNETFDLIEVSNISDSGYLGIHRTIGLMSSLLQPPSINPHATLITLFTNVVDENMTNAYQRADATVQSPSTKRLLKFLPPDHPPNSHYDPDVIKFSYALDCVRTYDHIFDR